MNNKGAKHDLEVVYGKGCMFKRAHIEELIERIGNIKTYRQYKEEMHYKRRKVNSLESSLTYHHLKHRSEGGHTTIDNGAVVNELAHRYMHSLPREQEEVINDILREFKFKLSGGILIPDEQGLQIQQPFSVDFSELDMTDYIEIDVYDNSEQDRQKFNRAKQKRDTRRLIQESLDGDDIYGR